MAESTGLVVRGEDDAIRTFVFDWYKPGNKKLIIKKGSRTGEFNTEDGYLINRDTLFGTPIHDEDLTDEIRNQLVEDAVFEGKTVPDEFNNQSRPGALKVIELKFKEIIPGLTKELQSKSKEKREKAKAKKKDSDNNIQPQAGYLKLGVDPVGDTLSYLGKFKRTVFVVGGDSSNHRIFVNCDTLIRIIDDDQIKAKFLIDSAKNGHFEINNEERHIRIEIVKGLKANVSMRLANSDQVVKFCLRKI